MVRHMISSSPEDVEELLMSFEKDSLLNSVTSYQKFPLKALELFEKIRDLLGNCMLKIKRESSMKDKYEVYRILNKILRFLSNMKYWNVYAFLKFDHAIENICKILQDTFKELKVYMRSFKELVSGFKTTDCVYSFSHEMVLGQIGHRIEILLNLLQRDWTQISDWRPTEALYMRTMWMGLIIATDDDVVITKEQIGTIDLKDVHDGNSDFMRSAVNTEVEEMDKLDWTLKGHIPRKNCPATYTIAKCRNMDHLLEIAKQFQNVVVTLEVIDSSHVDNIFLMCNALLTRAKEFVDELKINEVCELFNRVYSILDFILSSVVICKADEKSIIQISKECTYIMKLSSTFKDKFDHSDDIKYNDYVDVLYKYLVVYIKTANITFPDWPFFFVKYLSSTAIHRDFKPREVTIENYKLWDSKFKKLVELNSLNPEDPNLCCGICQKALNFTKPKTISVLENCEHGFCIKCLMETVNTSSDRPAMKTLRNSFQCPRNDCSAENESFTSGEQFKNFLNEVINFKAETEPTSDAIESENVSHDGCPQIIPTTQASCTPDSESKESTEVTHEVLDESISKNLSHIDVPKIIITSPSGAETNRDFESTTEPSTTTPIAVVPENVVQEKFPKINFPPTIRSKSESDLEVITEESDLVLEEVISENLSYDGIPEFIVTYPSSSNSDYESGDTMEVQQSVSDAEVSKSLSHDVVPEIATAMPDYKLDLSDKASTSNSVAVGEDNILHQGLPKIILTSPISEISDLEPGVTTSEADAVVSDIILHHGCPRIILTPPTPTNSDCEAEDENEETTSTPGCLEAELPDLHENLSMSDDEESKV